jgi:uncharacterized protein with NRDE domain
MYQFPDRGDVIENNMIIQVIYITYDVYRTKGQVLITGQLNTWIVSFWGF